MSNAFLLKQKLKQYLDRLFKPRQKTERKALLVQCIEKLGYLKQPVVNPVSVEQQELEQFMRSNSSSDSESETVDYVQFQQPQFRQSLQEQQQTSSVPGRTFIQSRPGTVDRLSVLNQRGMSSLEQEHAKIDLIFSEALNFVPESESVKRTAFNIYNQIENAYAQGLIKGILKATARKGFIFLSLYYALLEYGIYITRQALITKFDGYRLSDIPKSEKIMFTVFSDPGEPIYQLIRRSFDETSLCGMTEVLTEQQILEIRKGISSLKQNRVIPENPTVLQIAAAIHKFSGVSIKTISSYCGATPDTIRAFTF
jgi:hypothetical protein